MSHSRGQWPRVAENFVKLIKHPLRPVARDIDYLRNKLAQWYLLHKRPPSVLILGVTPEYYHLDWPEGTQVFALDQSPEMIQFVWPGSKEHAICGSWLDSGVPLNGQSGFDIVLSDGGLNVLAYPGMHTQLATRLSALVLPGGFFLTRLYRAAEKNETPERVLDNLFAGNIPSMNHLKVSLWTSMQVSPEQGVCLADIWNYLHDFEPDLDALARKMDWKIEEVQIIDAYQNNSAHYYFPGIEQVSDLLFQQSNGALSHPEVFFPDYQMGRQFPTLIFNRY